MKYIVAALLFATSFMATFLLRIAVTKNSISVPAQNSTPTSAYQSHIATVTEEFHKSGQASLTYNYKTSVPPPPITQ